MKEIFFILSLIILKIFLFNTEFVVYITFTSLFFIMYILSAESASRYFDDERSVLKNTILNHLAVLNNGLNATNGVTLEKLKLIPATNGVTLEKLKLIPATYYERQSQY